MQSVPITTKVVSSNPANPANGKVYIDTLYDKVCQLLTTGRWFSPGNPVSSIYRHDITDILLKVVLNPQFQFKRTMINIVHDPLPIFLPHFGNLLIV